MIPPKKLDKDKFNLTVGLTCLGECMPLETNICLSQEKAFFESKKRESPSTLFLMEQELDIVKDPMTYTLGNINLTAAPSNVMSTATPNNITPTTTPSNTTWTATPSSISLTATSNNITPTATPSNVTPTATPSNVNKVVQLQKATPSLVWPPDLIPIL